MIYIVYKITRDDGQIYIGTTYKNGYKSRIWNHKNSNRFHNHDFQIDILEENISYRYIEEREEFYIDLYDSYNNGLNKTIDGKGNHMSPKFTTKGYKFSDKSKKKMSNAHKGCTPWNKGRTGVFDNETLKKMSEKRKGKKGFCKLNKKDVIKILTDFNNHIFIDDDRIGKIMKNGKPMTYDRVFCKVYGKKYNLTEQCIYKLIKRETWKDVEI